MTAPVFFALAAAVLVGHPPARALRRLERAIPRRGSLRTVVMVSVGGAAVLIWALGGPRLAGWVLLAGMVTATAAWVIRGTRTDRRVTRERTETARAARTLALLLQAGQLPARALQDAADDCPVLAPAAVTGRLGGDVGQALADAGRAAGHDGLLRVSAAWRVSEATGAPIAPVLAGVAETLREERHLAGVVAAELAAARASGRIMAVLPFVAIALGTLIGAEPLAFLFGSWSGELALIAGVGLAAGGVVWTEKIARKGEPGVKGTG